MGIKRVCFAALCISVVTVGQCFAQRTGETFREACQFGLQQDDIANITLSEALAVGGCIGFVKAIVSLGSDLAERDRFCPPNGVDTEQAIRVLVKYLNEHPEIVEMTPEDPVMLSLRAFKAAWPCQ
jgi:hypothetical protein